MKCTSCGAEIAGDSRFCTQCGTAVNVSAAPAGGYAASAAPTAYAAPATQPAPVSQSSTEPNAFTKILMMPWVPIVLAVVGVFIIQDVFFGFVVSACGFVLAIQYIRKEKTPVNIVSTVISSICMLLQIIMLIENA
jgi:uncharacterized membrane protein YvbJ